MTRSRPARRSARRSRIRRRRRGAALAAIGALAVAGSQPGSPASSTIAAPVEVLRGERPRADEILRGERPRADGTAGGAMPARATAFDEDLPGVAKLDPALADALRAATAGAARAGIEILVESGWRSAAYQERLLREAVSEHGSHAEAARWVATPGTSLHVSGDAVDVGPAAAREWLARHGAAYGLCRVYGNEPWHFELRPEAAGRGCGPVYPDPTHDPRLQD